MGFTISNMYRVRASLSGWSGGPGLATFYYKTETPIGAGTSGGAQTVASRVRSAMNNLDTFWPAFMQIQVLPDVDVLEDSTGRLLNTWASGTQAVVSGTAGQSSGPLASMLCVNFLTLDIINGHRVKGRTFLGPLRQESDADGTPTARMITQGMEFGDDITSGSVLQQVVWHRPKGGLDGAACLVSSHNVHDRFAVLRSRRG
jgi:hypothetical protein